jgi:hypothetical protein
MRRTEIDVDGACVKKKKQSRSEVERGIHAGVYNASNS